MKRLELDSFNAEQINISRIFKKVFVWILFFQRGMDIYAVKNIFYTLSQLAAVVKSKNSKSTF